MKKRRKLSRSIPWVPRRKTTGGDDQKSANRKGTKLQSKLTQTWTEKRIPIGRVGKRETIVHRRTTKDATWKKKLEKAAVEGEGGSFRGKGVVSEGAGKRRDGPQNGNLSTKPRKKKPTVGRDEHIIHSQGCGLAEVGRPKREDHPKKWEKNQATGRQKGRFIRGCLS